MNDLIIKNMIDLIDENSIPRATRTFMSGGYLVRVNIESINNIELHFPLLSSVSYSQERTGNILFGEIHNVDLNKREVTVRWNDILSDKEDGLDVSVFPFDYAIKKLKVIPKDI